MRALLRPFLPIKPSSTRCNHTLLDTMSSSLHCLHSWRRNVMHQRSQFDRDPNQSTDRSKKRSIDRPADTLANRSTVFEPRSNRSIDKSDRSVNQLDKIRFGDGVEMWLILVFPWSHTRRN